jgi:hypothetical protein
MLATFLYLLIFLDFIILIILGDEYMLWNSLLCVLSLHPSRSKYSSQDLLHTILRFFIIFRIKLNLRRGVCSLTPKPKAWESPLVDCTRQTVQYIRNYPSYSDAVFSIRNLRTRWKP